QLAQLSKLADGITKGAKPPADALKISPQVAGVQGMLGGLKGGPHLNDAKQAVDTAAKSAAALKDEAVKKMAEPVGAAKEALTSLGKEVAAAGAPIKKVSDSLPQLKLPIGHAAGGLTDLKKSTPSTKKLQSPHPDIKGKLAPLQKQIPDAASQLSSPSEAVKGLTGKLKN